MIFHRAGPRCWDIKASVSLRHLAQETPALTADETITAAIQDLNDIELLVCRFGHGKFVDPLLLVDLEHVFFSAFPTFRQSDF